VADRGAFHSLQTVALGRKNKELHVDYVERAAHFNRLSYHVSSVLQQCNATTRIAVERLPHGNPIIEYAAGPELALTDSLPFAQPIRHTA